MKNSKVGMLPCIRRTIVWGPYKKRLFEEMHFGLWVMRLLTSLPDLFPYGHDSSLLITCSFHLTVVTPVLFL